MTSLTLRPATAADAADLARVAALDSRRLPAGPHLVAELDGRVVAALSRADGAVVADPFVPTAGAVALLRARARGLAPRPARRARIARRALRPALRAS